MGNVDVAGSGIYMWNDREQRKGMLVERRDLWSVPTMSPSWGRVKFAPDMDTQYSQKGDSDSLWSEVMKSFPSISCTCAGPLLGTCALLSIPMMSLSLSKNCFPRSGRITFHAAILTSTCSLSLPQPLYSTVLVLRFKWGNHRSISNLNFYQITQVGKLQLAMTFFFLSCPLVKFVLNCPPPRQYTQLYQDFRNPNLLLIYKSTCSSGAK